ncbi:MAG: hypothetical protein ACE5ES_00170 [Candidatus Nanoarchaeia archaeon]
MERKIIDILVLSTRPLKKRYIENNWEEFVFVNDPIVTEQWENIELFYEPLPNEDVFLIRIDLEADFKESQPIEINDVLIKTLTYDHTRARAKLITVKKL